eukprot:CAMPEP_0201997576 /NCGR_PEP_ID=MMETSP0905-20130828/4511_1 /ASSEMBLY_ACC=CAM_ASM_000554 /TAXON_ID=420261 /ORGANISM="Thalassiosira antarctica, Strain CCMP982" /LENGTH=98 /DNA_ID=CAMNT_0048553289 /DNA_START=267 /DNA_END=563 /DNA_ORIENTATION=+
MVLPRWSAELGMNFHGDAPPIIAYCEFTQWFNNNLPTGDIGFVEYGALAPWSRQTTEVEKIQQALSAVVAALFDINASQIGARQCYNENQAKGAPRQK